MGNPASKINPPTSSGRTFMLDAVREHGGGINCMALSEDSSVLVTGSEDRSIRIWTTKTKRCDCIGVLTGHEKYISCLIVEEIYVVSGSADNTIRKWDMSTCECLMIFRGHSGRVNKVICTGDFIFSSSNDRTLRCWDFDAGDCVREFTGHTNCVFPLLFIPADDEVEDDGYLGDEGDDAMGSKIKDVIVSGSSDCTARSWSFETGKTIRIFKGHQGIVTAIATDTDAKVLFTASTDATVRSWRLDTGEKIRTFEGHGSSVICMTKFTILNNGPDYVGQVVNHVIYTGSSDHSARGWTIDWGNKEVIVYSGQTNTVFCVKYIDGMVFTGGGDGSVVCFDSKTGDIKRIFRGPPQTAINSMQFVENRMFTGSTDGTMRVWTLRGLRKNTTVDSEQPSENDTAKY